MTEVKSRDRNLAAVQVGAWLRFFFVTVALGAIAVSFGCHRSGLSIHSSDGSAGAGGAGALVSASGGNPAGISTPAGTGGVRAASGGSAGLGTGGIVGTGGGGAGRMDGGSGGGRPASGGSSGRGGQVGGLDSGSDACAAALPIKCGQEVRHSTLVEGRSNLWSAYASTQRLESGPETLYVFSTNDPLVVIHLGDLTADLDVFLLSSCGSASSIAPLSLDQSSTRKVFWFEFPFVNSTSPEVTYYLVVDGYNGAAGNYTLNLTCTN